MPRTVIVGDLHGCRRELGDLLSYIGFSRGDRLYSVGDVVVRGPDPHGTVSLLRQKDARAVRGNHEDRLLAWKHAGRRKEKKPSIGKATRRTAEELRPRDWAWLEAQPLWIDLPEHGVRIVHAGLVPGIPIERQDPRNLLYMRSIGERGEPIEERGSTSWAHRYEGPWHVVFGHYARSEPDIARFATGIDTGVVYGGRLTAMVLREGESPPPPEHRKSVLVSVPARRAWVPR
jgi:hypothetical protein